MSAVNPLGPVPIPYPLTKRLNELDPSLTIYVKPTPTQLISIDTTKATVAEAALEAGADIINDISALQHDPDMAPLAAHTKAGVILMHKQGTPQTMQKNPPIKTSLKRSGGT